MSLRLAAWIGALIALAIGEGPADACDARITIDPTTAFVGQPVRHEIVVDGVAPGTTIEWLHPPDFPDARASLLRPSPSDADTRATVRRQTRVLHPARAGRLTLPPTAYRCRPTTGGASVDRETPTVTLDVRGWPETGRPASWRGLVGTVSVQVQASSTRVHVGESITLVARVSGTGLMRQAGFTWPVGSMRAQPVAPELFPSSSPDFDAQTGTRRVGRRIEHLEVVPHAPGQLRVPGIAVAWLDPANGKFRASTSEAFTVEVLPERSDARSASHDPSSGGAAEAPSPHNTTRIIQFGLGALGVTLAVAIAAARRALKRRGGRNGA